MRELLSSAEYGEVCNHAFVTLRGVVLHFESGAPHVVMKNQKSRLVKRGIFGLGHTSLNSGYPLYTGWIGVS